MAVTDDPMTTAPEPSPLELLVEVLRGLMCLPADADETPYYTIAELRAAIDTIERGDQAPALGTTPYDIGQRAIRSLEEAVDSMVAGTYQSHVPDLLRGMLSVTPDYEFPEYVPGGDEPIITPTDIRDALDTIERGSTPVIEPVIEPVSVWTHLAEEVAS